MIRGVNLAYYQETDWQRFLEIVDDRESMHETWQEWYQDVEKLRLELLSEGFIVNYVKVDLDALDSYCKERNIKNNGVARSQFVSGKDANFLASLGLKQ